MRALSDSCWLEAKHPDANGEQLRHIVDTLEKRAGQWREFFDDMGVFWDWGSMYQKDPALFDARETPEAKPEAERPAFLQALKDKTAVYGGDKYEQSRTPLEKEAFSRALLDTMDVWCACMPAHSLSRARPRLCVRTLPAPRSSGARPRSSAAPAVLCLTGMLIR